MALVGSAALVAGATATACAQSLERRVTAAPDGDVTFHFAPRPEVCGDGRTYLRVDGDAWYGSTNDAIRGMPCERGPVRVVLVRDGRDLLRVRTFAGPLSPERQGTDLGAVAAADAASYLLGMAARVDGRPGRDAIMPAMLADSATVSRELLAIARDAERGREVRRSALSWLVRRRAERGGLSPDELVRTLVTIARDDAETRSVREQALSSLARLENNAALDALVTMSRDASEGWLARRSIEVLASSGDPRARQHLRAAAERTDLAEEARAAAITVLAGEYATARDAEFLRGLYPRLGTDRLRDAVMNGVANVGGRENRDWIVGIARNGSEPVRQRRRAIELADRVGIGVAELSRIYDAADDPELRVAIINQLAQLGSSAASEKLMAIARDDPMVSNRRRAIQALGRFDDSKVKAALRGMVEKR